MTLVLYWHCWPGLGLMILFRHDQNSLTCSSSSSTLDDITDSVRLQISSFVCPHVRRCRRWRRRARNNGDRSAPPSKGTGGAMGGSVVWWWKIEIEFLICKCINHELGSFFQPVLFMLQTAWEESAHSSKGALLLNYTCFLVCDGTHTHTGTVWIGSGWRECNFVVGKMIATVVWFSWETNQCPTSNIY